MEIEYTLTKGFTLEDLEMGDGFHTPEEADIFYMKIRASDSIRRDVNTDGFFVLNLQNCIIMLWDADTPVVPVLLEKVIIKEKRHEN